MEDFEVKEEQQMQEPQFSGMGGFEPKKTIQLSLKHVGIIIAVCVLIVILLVSGGSSQTEQKIETIYFTMKESADSLDQVADAIYNNWYDCVYRGKYSSIDSAILIAQMNQSANIEKIKDNDIIIDELLQEVKGKCRNKELYNSMLDAYDAYKEYYEFVINVSGSFNSYSAKKEDIKKEVKSYLSKFQRNL